MTTPFGFAIIGCGTIAEVHASAIGEVAGARLVLASSRDRKKAEAFAGKHLCRFTDDHRTLLADPEVDVVSVTTSSGSHAAIALEAIRAGKHVIVEKPMAMNAADARTLVEAAEKGGRELAVVFQRRFESHHRATKRALESGALGKVLLAEVACPYYRTQAYYDSADWRGTIAEDGGALMNQAIHSVDLLLWLCGPATSVLAETATQTHRMEAEDMALAIARLQSGGLATLMASTSIKPGFTATLAIYGELGTIKLSGPEIVHWTVPGIPAPEAPARSAVAVATNILASHEQHRDQFVDLVAALREGRSSLVTGRDGFQSVALVEAIYRAAATRSPAAVASL